MWRPGCGDRTHPSWPASRTTVWCSTPARSFPGSSTSSSGRYGPRSMARAVFLDRDGTILEDPGFLHQPGRARLLPGAGEAIRSEEHTSELQSPCNLVCRLLLEKKK